MHIRVSRVDCMDSRYSPCSCWTVQFAAAGAFLNSDGSERHHGCHGFSRVAFSVNSSWFFVTDVGSPNAGGIRLKDFLILRALDVVLRTFFRNRIFWVVAQS